MLTSMRVANFKAWRDTGQIRLAPLTVIFGANSAGKSSLGHLLLALKQTALSSDRRGALQLGDTATLIDLGTFTDCLYNHDTTRALRLALTWSLPTGLEVRNPLQRGTLYAGDRLSLDATIGANAQGQPETQRLTYKLAAQGRPVLSVLHEKRDGKWQMDSDEYQFVPTEGRKWPLEGPEKFYRFSEVTQARFKNAGFLSDFALATEGVLRELSYLGPLREHPKRTYQWAGDAPEDVGQKGEFAVAAILAAQAQGRSLNRGHRKRLRGFADFVAAWLADMGVISQFTVKPVAEGRKEYEVLLKTYPAAPEVKITDVGFGVSQVLPALVQAFYSPPNSVVWMEQPEIHLHPSVQSTLADVFVSAIQSYEGGEPRNVQLIVESHSEHFLNRLQRRVAEGVLAPEDVAIYFCNKRASGQAELEPLRLNLFGEIENWPENFFGDEMEDLTARTVAAMKRRATEAVA